MTVSVALFVAGAKGANFLARFLERLKSAGSDISIERCVSYPSAGLQLDSFNEIKGLCESSELEFRTPNQFRSETDAQYDAIFLIGWQYVLEEISDYHIVFHDSLLPRLRGFNPTVTALISGETQLGVTVFRPDGGMDTGPILAQRSFEVTYPIKIREAYAQVASLYVDLSFEVIKNIKILRDLEQRQVDAEATYSIWRNNDDYQINWDMTAGEVKRFIDAVGWPYLGAKTFCNGEELRIHDAYVQPDLTFAIRQPGKVLAIHENGSKADIICGSGILRVQQVLVGSGVPFVFNRLRVRLT